MAVFRITVTYRDTVSGLSWSNTNYRTEATYAAAFAALDTWNDAYMGCCHANNEPVGAAISGQTVGMPTEFFGTAHFTTQFGQLGGTQPADGLALLLQGTGNFLNGGLSNWFLHGLSTAYIFAPDRVNEAHAAIVAAQAAAVTYFRQYRPTVPAGSSLPVVDPPVAFLTIDFADTLHLRRLGRPFLHNGQTHRYQH